MLMSHRHADRHMTILLFAEHATILSSDADGVTPFLRDPGVVDDSCGPRTVAFQGGQHGLPGHALHGAIVPGGVRDEVMHRLVRVGTWRGSTRAAIGSMLFRSPGKQSPVT